jgi:dihydroorotate dehydrogenase
MVLFETYDNPLADVPQAKKMFEQAVDEVKRGTGHVPLVVKIPPLSMDMLYCNRHFLDNRDALSAVRESTEGTDMGDTVRDFRTIADAVIQYR